MRVTVLHPREPGGKGEVKRDAWLFLARHMLRRAARCEREGDRTGADHARHLAARCFRRAGGA
ncbi:MAG: hypothetical protein ACLFRZ_10995 [Rhodosalinus sp.]